MSKDLITCIVLPSEEFPPLHSPTLVWDSGVCGPGPAEAAFDARSRPDRWCGDNGCKRDECGRGRQGRGQAAYIHPLRYGVFAQHCTMASPSASLSDLIKSMRCDRIQPSRLRQNGHDEIIADIAPILQICTSGHDRSVLHVTGVSVTGVISIILISTEISGAGCCTRSDAGI